MSGEDNSGIGKRRSGQKWMVMGGVGGMQSREDGDGESWRDVVTVGFNEGDGAIIFYSG